MALSATDADAAQFVQWCTDVRASNRTAFATLFAAMHAPLLRYAIRMTGDTHGAKDVVQDVFIKLWQVRDTLDENRSLKALLYTMVRNTALNHNRSTQRLEAVEPEDVAALQPSRDGVADRLDADQLSAHLQRWMHSLPPRRREAFMLSRLQGLSHDEIAEVMGLTTHTVNSHIVLALKDLRVRLDRLESSPLSA